MEITFKVLAIFGGLGISFFLACLVGAFYRDLERYWKGKGDNDGLE